MDAPLSRARALAGEFRAFLVADAGTAIPEYAIVTAVFGIAAISALLVVGTNAAAQLTGTQGRVQTASLGPPAP